VLWVIGLPDLKSRPGSVEPQALEKPRPVDSEGWEADSEGWSVESEADTAEWGGQHKPQHEAKPQGSPAEKSRAVKSYVLLAVLVMVMVIVGVADTLWIASNGFRPKK
jgi:hypothetical protein